MINIITRDISCMQAMTNQQVYICRSNGMYLQWLLVSLGAFERPEMGPSSWDSIPKLPLKTRNFHVHVCSNILSILTCSGIIALQWAPEAIYGMSLSVSVSTEAMLTVSTSLVADEQSPCSCCLLSSTESLLTSLLVAGFFFFFPRFFCWNCNS